MMDSAFFAIGASVLYVVASVLIWQKIRRFDRIDLGQQRRRIITTALLAIILHSLLITFTLWQNDHLVFNLANALSLIAFIASGVLLILNRQFEAETLGIFLFPLAAISTLLPLVMLDYMPLAWQIGSHVFISIAAYSLLGISAAQAVLYSIQEKRFRARQLSNLMRALPPLQVMEQLMFRLVIIGFVLLSFALVSGFFFVEDLFAQHLVHKTFFAIVSWVLYAVLLLGHFQRGWRGQKAVRYVIWAYLLLFISFIGTEVILQSFILNS